MIAKSYREHLNPGCSNLNWPVDIRFSFENPASFHEYPTTIFLWFFFVIRFFPLNPTCVDIPLNLGHAHTTWFHFCINPTFIDISSQNTIPIRFFSGVPTKQKSHPSYFQVTYPEAFFRCLSEWGFRGFGWVFHIWMFTQGYHYFSSPPIRWTTGPAGINTSPCFSSGFSLGQWDPKKRKLPRGEIRPTAIYGSTALASPCTSFLWENPWQSGKKRQFFREGYDVMIMSFFRRDFFKLSHKAAEWWHVFKFNDATGENFCGKGAASFGSSDHELGVIIS